MDKCQPFQSSSFGDSSLKNYTCASGTGTFAFCFSREFFLSREAVDKDVENEIWAVYVIKCVYISNCLFK